MKRYNKRTWLNNDSSRSTGSVVAFHGVVDYGDEQQETMFLEVADCNCKIRLHRAGYDTTGDFIKKMKLLRNELNKFIDHLKECK